MAEPVDICSMASSFNDFAQSRTLQQTAGQQVSCQTVSDSENSLCTGNGRAGLMRSRVVGKQYWSEHIWRLPHESDDSVRQCQAGPVHSNNPGYVLQLCEVIGLVGQCL